MPKSPSAEAGGRSQRQRAVNDYKRQIILDAAKRIFATQGLEGASIRAIAKEAGYTAGAIYFHYQSKEEIYGDLLSESLQRLHETVRASMAEAGIPQQRVTAAAFGFFDYYRDNPQDLELGFYLFRGMRPLGLSPMLDKQLNEQLRYVLAEVEHAMLDLGATSERALRETVALFGHSVGLLLLMHTGRMKIFGLDGRDLFRDYLAQMILRLQA